MRPPEDRRRFEEVYAACHDPVLAYLMRRTDHGEDAADVLAETFLVAWRRLDEIPPGDGARPWLYGVARRTLANHHRGARRRSALSERLRAELRPHDRTSEPHLADDAVADAFRGLSDDDRELLSLVGWEGLDAGQIAVVLGCSRNAARIRLHRARRRFARALESRQARQTHPRGARIAKKEHA
ncbi:sigma-70 family RNA polymerase sigma factor [Spirillospora sp. NPDC052269]